MYLSFRYTCGQTYVFRAIKYWFMRSVKRNAWKHVTFRKYVAATRNSPGYVVLNHRPRRNARTYTLPGSGGTFLQKVSRKARSLFRKTSSNVPTPPRPVPPPPSPYPPPPQVPARYPGFFLLPSFVSTNAELSTGFWWNPARFMNYPRSAQLWQVICTRAAPRDRHPNLFRLSCKLAGMSKVVTIREAQRAGCDLRRADGQWKRRRNKNGAKSTVVGVLTLAFLRTSNVCGNE